MEISFDQSWLNSLRAAGRILRERAAGKTAAPASADFPLNPMPQTGLRGLEQTQSLEVQETKGRIIDRYL